MFDEYVDIWMVYLVITLGSNPRGLRFEYGFNHHNYLGLKGLENCFHNSLTSMLDECVDV